VVVLEVLQFPLAVALRMKDPVLEQQPVVTLLPLIPVVRVVWLLEALLYLLLIAAFPLHLYIMRPLFLQQVP